MLAIEGKSRILAREVTFPNRGQVPSRVGGAIHVPAAHVAGRVEEPHVLAVADRRPRRSVAVLVGHAAREPVARERFRAPLDGPGLAIDGVTLDGETGLGAGEGGYELKKDYVILRKGVQMYEIPARRE